MALNSKAPKRAKRSSPANAQPFTHRRPVAQPRKISDVGEPTPAPGRRPPAPRARIEDRRAFEEHFYPSLDPAGQAAAQRAEVRAVEEANPHAADHLGVLPLGALLAYGAAVGCDDLLGGYLQAIEVQVELLWDALSAHPLGTSLALVQQQLQVAIELHRRAGGAR